MATLKPMSRAEICASNCGQVAFVLRNKTREDREALAEGQLREAGPVIDELVRALTLVGEPQCCLGIIDCDGSHYPDEEACCAVRRALRKI